MTKPVRLNASAQREAEDAFAWYEERETGLGERFLQALAQTLDRVGRCPEACAPVDAGLEAAVRAARVKDFPFRVLFVELPDRWRVFAVAHHSREPRYWTSRLSE